MTRKIVSPPQAGIKDDKGSYLPVGAPPAPPKLSTAEVELEAMLKKQLLALARITKHLVERSAAGATKDDVLSLATLIKVTLDLRDREKDFFDGLTDEELEELTKSQG